MKGIAKRTTKLGFNILRLHFSCDPDKDPETEAGKRWYDDARRGMSDARWRQEFEIDYGALGGQRVFPEFEETLHVVPAQLPIDPLRITTWLAADPHPRTPHAFVWASVNKEGDIAVVWSWWPDKNAVGAGAELAEKPRPSIPECCEYLRKAERLIVKPYRRLMDVAGKSFNASEEQDYFEAFRTAKMTREVSGKITTTDVGVSFNPAKKDIGSVGYELINQALKPRPVNLPDGTIVNRPRLTIWGRCGDNDELVYQFKTLRYREWKGQVTDKDAPEEPQDKRRHLLDCLKYIFLDRPRFVDRTPQDNSDQDYHNVVIATGGRF